MRIDRRMLECELETAVSQLFSLIIALRIVANRALDSEYDALVTLEQRARETREHVHDVLEDVLVGNFDKCFTKEG